MNQEYSPKAKEALDFLTREGKDYCIEFFGNNLILTMPISETRLPDKIKAMHEGHARGFIILDMNNVLEQVYDRVIADVAVEPLVEDGISVYTQEAKA